MFLKQGSLSGKRVITTEWVDGISVEILKEQKEWSRY